MSEEYILLVEDNPDDYEVILKSLKSCDFSFPVKWFTNSQSALDYLNTNIYNLPALMMLDLNLPGIDGRKCLEIIKSNNSLKSIPILIFTTSSDSKDIEYCYQSGANSYIQKPVSYYKMKELCKTLIEYWFNAVILLPQEDHNNVEK